MSDRILLPPPETASRAAMLIRARRSSKAFASAPIDLPDAAGALWAAAGATAPGHRSTPSAHASYPVSVTLIARAVRGLAPGAYAHSPADHSIHLRADGNLTHDIASVTLDAGWLTECSALLLFSADMRRAHERFASQSAQHGERFVWIEVGHAAQNVYLWAADHDLGTCLVAGLDDEAAGCAGRDLIPVDHTILGVMALGRMRL